MTPSTTAEESALDGRVAQTRDRRLRLLLVSKRLPLATADHAGGQITHFYLEKAVRWADVDLIALATQQETNVGIAPVHALDVIRCPLDGTDASSLRGMWLRAGGYARLLRTALRRCQTESYDLILLERSALGWMAPILAKFAKRPIVLVAHDLWFDRLESEERKSTFPRSTYFSILGFLARRVERLGVTGSAGIICYDTRTKALILDRLSGQRAAPPIEVLPPQHRVWSADDAGKRPASISFYGNMARSANWRSAIWFLQEIYPSIRARIPEATFHVVGANPPPTLSRFHDGNSIFVTGFLSEPDALLTATEVFVAPLVAGTGIKIKVLEAMASGIPVVANEIAMQGIPAVADQDYLHAEDESSFATQVVRLLSDPQLRDRIGRSGRRLRETSLDPAQGDTRNREFLELVIEGALAK